jgi:hypothetical protein
VLELFQGPLADQRFADLDAEVLSKSASLVEAAAAAVAEQEAQLTELRQTLADRQEALLLLAQRALAYARVYAENDSTLSEELSRISLPRANTLPRTPKPRKLSSKLAGSDSDSSVAAEPSATHEPVTECAALPADREAADPSTDAPEPSVEAQPVEAQPVEAQPVEAQPVEAQPVEAQAARKGKRRSGVASSEATGQPT